MLLNLKSSNTSSSQINSRLQRDFKKDAGLHFPFSEVNLSIGSTDGYGPLHVDLIDRTGAFINLANLDPDIHLMTRAVSMKETYFTTVRSSVDIPKFLLWLQEKVSYLSFIRMIAHVLSTT